MADEQERRWDFFVSYTQSDRRWAEWVAWQLEEAGYRVLVQAWDFVAGTNWQAGMQRGIDGSDRTIALLSPAYLRSVYGQREWQAAQAADPYGFTRKLIPVRVADCDRPGPLASIVSFDLFDLDADAAGRYLIDQVRSLLAGRAKPVRSPDFPGQSTGGLARKPDFPGQLASAPAGPGPAWARPYAPLATYAAAAMVTVGLASGVQLLLLGTLVLGAAAGAQAFAIAVLLVLGLLALLGLLVGAAIAVPLWMHRAFRNLPALGAGPLTWSPGWAAGGWFVPGANLVVPYLVAREIWRQVQTDTERPWPLVQLWWTAWIAAGVLRLVGAWQGATGVATPSILGWADSIMLALAWTTAGVLLIIIIRRVSRRQRAARIALT